VRSIFDRPFAGIWRLTVPAATAAGGGGPGAGRAPPSGCAGAGRLAATAGWLRAVRWLGLGCGLATVRARFAMRWRRSVGT